MSPANGNDDTGDVPEIIDDREVMDLEDMMALDQSLLGGELADDDGDDGGGMGGFDLGSLLEQATQMQQQLMAAQQAAAAEEVEGHAGGGMVRIVVTGGMEFHAVRIDPSAIDPDDPELLEDLILAALHDAVAKVNDLGQSTLGGLDMGSLLGGASGLFGGGDIELPE